MSFGKNLQYLRRLSGDITQEMLAEKLDVSRQAVSKWESDQALPEMDKALEICKAFNCTLDNLFRDDMATQCDNYSDIRVERVKGFRYVEYTVVSTDPEGDALGRVHTYAKENGVENPRVIGWDFPFVSVEQINVHHMHGYTAAWILPDGLTPEGLKIKEQGGHNYAAIHIERPFDNPFVIIPGAYKTLMDYMKVNGLIHDEKVAGIIPCFETDGENMDVYIACK